VLKKYKYSRVISNYMFVIYKERYCTRLTSNRNLKPVSKIYIMSIIVVLTTQSNKSNLQSINVINTTIGKLVFTTLKYKNILNVHIKFVEKSLRNYALIVK
jgi:type III secretory pathway component EscU